MCCLLAPLWPALYKCRISGIRFAHIEGAHLTLRKNRVLDARSKYMRQGVFLKSRAALENKLNHLIYQFDIRARPFFF